MTGAEYGLGLDKTFGQSIYDLDGALTFNNNDKTINYVPAPGSSPYSSDDLTLIGGYVATSGTCNGQYELRVYYFDSYSTEEAISNFVTTKEAITYKKGTTTVAAAGEENVYTPSSVYFFKNTL